MRFLSTLAPGELIAVTEDWTGNLKPVFLSVAELANLLPRVLKDHEALLGARSSATADRLVQTLSDKATALDGRHDHGMRALDYGLAAAEEAALALDPPDTAFAADVEHAHAALLPTGLSVITASYMAEAGNTAQMVKLADADLAPVLSKVPIREGMSALDLVHLLGNVGSDLGTTEREKLEAEAAAEKEAVPPAEVKRRMRKLADTIALVLNVLEDSSAPADVVDKLRRPVIEATEKARLRRQAEIAAAKKKAAEAEAEAKAKAKAEAKAKTEADKTGGD